VTDDRMAEDYLAELDALAGAQLTAARRRELVTDIRDHIESAAGGGESAAGVIGRLGTPAEIVAAESQDVRLAPADASESRLRGQDKVTIGLLLIGGFACGVGWVVGVVMLWLSDRWTTRDKFVGTFVLPGGLLAVAVAGGAVGTTSTSTETCTDDGCTSYLNPGSSGTSPWLGIGILVLLTVLPILTSIYLARRAKLPV
jgi:hypothetical protein